MKHLTLKQLRSASAHTLSQEIKNKNPWTSVHIRSQYNCSVDEWLEQYSRSEQVWEWLELTSVFADLWDS